MDTPTPKISNLRILVISPWKSRWSLGKGAGVSDDYHFISQLTATGFELHFLVPRSRESDDLEFENLFFHTYPNFFDGMRGWPTVFKRVLWPLIFWTLVSTRAVLLGRKLKPHFILGHSHYGTVPAYMCRELLRVPSGVKLFGVMDLVHTEWPRLKYYFKNLEHIFAMKIPQDLWIILDDGTKGRDAAIRHGVPAHKIHFLPNGINLEWAERTFDRDKVREEFAVPRDAKVVLFLARLVASKRPQLFIQALPEVKRRLGHPVIFLIVGDGPEREDCESLKSRLGLGDDLRLLGALPHKRVPEIMAAADLFASTSRLTNAAIPTCEAMVCGLPVVAFDVGNTREVVRHGDTGLVVADGDVRALVEAIVELLSNDRRRGEMAQQSKSVAAERFTAWEDRIEMEVRAIRSAVDETPS